MADKSEILMKIVASGSSAIAAECALAINPDDQLMEGFEAGKFFQIKDFNFSAGLQDESGASAAGGEPGGASGTGSGCRNPGRIVTHRISMPPNRPWPPTPTRARRSP